MDMTWGRGRRQPPYLLEAGRPPRLAGAWLGPRCWGDLRDVMDAPTGRAATDVNASTAAYGHDPNAHSTTGPQLPAAICSAVYRSTRPPGHRSFQLASPDRAMRQRRPPRRYVTVVIRFGPGVALPDRHTSPCEFVTIDVPPSPRRPVNVALAPFSQQSVTMPSLKKRLMSRVQVPAPSKQR